MEKQEYIFNKKWLWAGIIISLLNPVFSGLILGSLYLTESGLKKYGRIILIFSLLWGMLAFWLYQRFVPPGLM